MSPDHVSLDDLSNIVNRCRCRSLAGSEVVAQLVHHCHPEAEERQLSMVDRQLSVCHRLKNVCIHHWEVVEQAEDHVLPPLASGVHTHD